MGGNAIADARRIDRKEFFRLYNQIKELFPELEMDYVKFFRKKESFGDIDIVVKTQPSLNIKELVKSRLPDLVYNDNNMFFSFEYEGVQIDFIFMSPTYYRSALDYFSFNDLGNFIGRVARSLNFKYGHDGLSYDEHLDDHYKLTVPISTDMYKILRFLGYDPTRWEQGFETEEEIFAYAASSRYFDATYFSLEEQNNADRVRNRKRKMYQKMLEYITENDIKPLGLSDSAKLSKKEQAFQEAVYYFGNDFSRMVDQKKSDYQRHLAFKHWFNGDIVRDLTGLEGKELGAFMQRMRQRYDLDFEEVVLAGGPRVVEDLVLFNMRNKDE